MMYFGCYQCGEARTEYEIFMLQESSCRVCGCTRVREAARPPLETAWFKLRFPFYWIKYTLQEKKFRENAHSV